MDKRYALLSLFAGLVIVGLIKGAKSPSTEFEICRRQASDRLVKALGDDSVSGEEWNNMLMEEVNFLKLIEQK